MTPTGTTIQPHRGSYLTPAFEHARVRDAMRYGIFTCGPETPLTDVARMMATHHVHSVVITDLDAGTGDERPWGVVSDLDLVRAGDATERTAGDVAGTELVTIAANETLERAAQLMGEHGISHLVVVQPAGGRPVGVLSTLDVAGVLAWGEG